MTTISTRFMIISDTHEHSLDGANMQAVDVLLHTGDLTNFGELNSLREAIKMMGTIKAELTLVIAGNHDLSLDPTNRIENMSDEEYAKYHAEAMEIMTGPDARKAGVIYLEEGFYDFELQNGATFKVYASPYTPGSGGWAFPYTNVDDRFNSYTSTNEPTSAKNPIPANIDIVMTHGPPHSVLDQVDGENLGCPKLLRAISRARPLMHCFGHIHEGHGAHIVDWRVDGKFKNPEAATPLETEQMNEYPGTCEWDIKRGEQTLMVNAAIMRNTGRGMKPDYLPFIVALDLERKDHINKIGAVGGARIKKRRLSESGDESRELDKKSMKQRKLWC